MQIMAEIFFFFFYFNRRLIHDNFVSLSTGCILSNTKFGSRYSYSKLKKLLKISYHKHLF